MKKGTPYPIEMSAKWQMPDAPTPDAPTPVFRSWSDYLAETSVSQRMKRCHAAAKKANAKRLMSDSPETRLSGHDVWAIVEAAQGRCTHCGSLAVENRPSNLTTGAPVPWAHVGRRIGSLEHLQSRYSGGGNDLPNLAWACLWCNTWRKERRPQAADHGGYYPVEPPPGASAGKPMIEPKKKPPRPYDVIEEEGDFYNYVDQGLTWTEAYRAARKLGGCGLIVYDRDDRVWRVHESGQVKAADAEETDFVLTALSDMEDYGFEMYPDHEGLYFGGRD
jgi:hypothetical protein